MNGTNEPSVISFKPEGNTFDGGGPALSEADLRAIAIALDELKSYVETVGYEGALDDEELPTEKLNWAVKKLGQILERYGASL